MSCICSPKFANELHFPFNVIKPGIYWLREARQDRIRVSGLHFAKICSLIRIIDLFVLFKLYSHDFIGDFRLLLLIFFRSLFLNQVLVGFS